MRYLLDGGILLRLAVAGDPAHKIVRDAVDKLLAGGDELCFTFQLMREFWSVATRPQSVNGYGLNTAQATTAPALFPLHFSYLADSESVRDEWLVLVTKHNVVGKNAHDAGHVAAMKAHGISLILSLDQRDFSRYSEVQVIRPEAILAR